MNTLGADEVLLIYAPPNLMRPYVLPHAAKANRLPYSSDDDVWRLHREERDGDAVAAAGEERLREGDQEERGGRLGFGPLSCSSLLPFCEVGVRGRYGPVAAAL